jgi:hypothetical protein
LFSVVSVWVFSLAHAQRRSPLAPHPANDLVAAARDRLAEITTRFDLYVQDRRSGDSHIDAIVQKRSLDFTAVLDVLKREELQIACEQLGLDTSGREKAKLQFRTSKPTRPTVKSHISDVVLDSTWEGSAAHYLETCLFVIAYAKNDRLDFDIQYRLKDETPRYLPDFLVDIDVEEGRRVKLILEIKGSPTSRLARRRRQRCSGFAP